MMDKNKKILISTRFYLPAYLSGGPIQTIAAFSYFLNKDFDIYIMTTDRDSGSSSAFSNIQLNSWVSTESSQNYYFGKGKISFYSLSGAIKKLNPDIIYISSFFDYVFTIRILFLRKIGLINKSIPIILAVRGEFAQSALRQQKLKKKIYLFLFNFFRLYDNINFHLSSNLEYSDFKKLFNKYSSDKVFVLNDLSLMKPINLKDKLRLNLKTNKLLKICFVSRISPVKNLDYALLVLTEVKANVDFDIYGPISDQSYWLDCQKIIEKMPNNINVNYCSSIKHDKVQSTISNYDVFFLPTKGENFGHIIIESLASATPVLISDNTQWTSLNVEKGGWAYPLSDSLKFVQTIEELAKLNITEHKILCEYALNYYLNNMDQSLLIEKYKKVFLNLIR